VILLHLAVENIFNCTTKGLVNFYNIIAPNISY